MLKPTAHFSLPNTIVSNDLTYKIDRERLEDCYDLLSFALDTFTGEFFLDSIILTTNEFLHAFILADTSVIRDENQASEIFEKITRTLDLFLEDKKHLVDRVVSPIVN